MTTSAITTRTANEIPSAGRVARLRDAGFDDEEIITAALTVGYFNFVNRMVTGLGVELESNVHDQPYKY